jgi:hypothetical protein
MMIESLIEMQYLMYTFFMLIILFSVLFFIQGIELQDTTYTQVGVLGVVLATLQESFGNFGTISVY